MILPSYNVIPVDILNVATKVGIFVLVGNVKIMLVDQDDFILIHRDICY